jgi:hypothetical protein
VTEHAKQALDLIKRHWPDATSVEAEDGRYWVRLESYPAPAGWTADATTVVFVIPNEAAQAPYGFYVPRAFLLRSNGHDIAPTSHYTREAQGVPDRFAGEWSMFSWGPLAWSPEDSIVTFVRSFGERLAGLE